MAIQITRQTPSKSVIIADPAISDEMLIERIQKHNDDRAFAMLMARHRGIVWRAVKQYLGSLSEAEDIFQEVSLQFYRIKDTYTPGGAKFSSWLYKVTANKCLDMLRLKSSKNHIELKDDVQAAEQNPLEQMETSQIACALQRVLDDLPVQQKMALSMYYLEECSIDNISQKLLVTEGAARALIKRGKEKLRQHSDLEHIARA